MKLKSFHKEIRRTITHTLSRFLAIAAIVALGAGFLSGLIASSPVMRLRADAYYDHTGMMDIRILSTLGLTKEDLSVLTQIEGVQTAEGAHFLDIEGTIGEDSYLIRVHSLPGQINQLVLEEGRLPKAGECVFNQGKIKSGKIHIGDVLVVQDEDGLTHQEYTIVGMVRDPQYLSFSFGSTNMGDGALDYAVYVPDAEFTADYLSEIRILVSDAETKPSFSNSYLDMVNPVKERIEDIQEDREQARYDQLVSEIEKELDEARAKLETHEQEYQDGLSSYESAKEEYERVRKETESTLEEKEAELDQADKDLKSAEEEISQAEEELAENKEKLDQAATALFQAENEIAAGERALAGSKSELDAAAAELAENEKALAAAKEELDQNRKLLDETAQTLAASKEELDQAEEGLDTLKAGLDALDEQVSELSEKILEAQTAAETYRAAGMEEEALSYEQICADLTETYDRLLEQRNGVDQQYQQAKSAYEQGLEAYQDGLGTYQSGEAAYLGAEEEYERGMDVYAAAVSQYEAGLAAYQEAAAQIEDAKKELSSRRAQYETGLLQYQEGLDQVQSGKEELEEGRKQAEEGRKALEEARIEAREQFAETETELEDARQDLEEAADELEKGRKELQDAEKEAYDQLTMPEWYILTREQNEGYVSYRNDADRMRQIATVFPWMFFFVAALVSLTSMTRMVEEERVLIGTYKALGFTKERILYKYLVYAALASVLGGLAGVAVLMKVLPFVICKAYDTMYIVPEPIRTPYYPSYTILSIGLSILCTTGATLLAGYHTLSSVPAALMLPEAPKAGKRIFLEHIRPIWKHLSFTQKVTARNLFRYKKRLIMTIIGIGGCTALLVTGFGLHDSVSGILEKQYGQIYRYGVLAGFEKVENADEIKEAMHEYLPDTEWMLQMTKQGEIRHEGHSADINLYVPEQTEGFADFVDLRTRRGQKRIPFTEDSVVVSEKLAEKLGVSVGSTIEWKNEKGHYVPLTVTGICEQYVYDYVYLSRKCLESTLGDPWQPSEMDLLEADEEQIEILKTRIPEVVTVSKVADVIRTFEKMIRSLNLVIGVLIISAGVLAFIVLYNLTNINVMERQREIATIKVLGFFQKEVGAYIYRETLWLTLIGCVLGLIAGIFMHRFVITTVEVDVVMFSRTIHSVSFVYSALLTGVFSIIVGIVMSRKLKRISMVESLKSVD